MYGGNSWQLLYARSQKVLKEKEDGIEKASKYRLTRL